MAPAVPPAASVALIVALVPAATADRLESETLPLDAADPLMSTR